MARRLAILLLAAVVAGCSYGGAGTVKPQLPNLPAQAKQGCAKPVARVGEDARAFAARAVAAFNCEKHTLDEVVAFYADLQRKLAAM